MTIDLITDYERHLHDLSRSGETIDCYVGLLRRMDRELPYGLYAAMGAELRDWIYVDGRSSNTRALYRTAVCGFFGWAADPDTGPLDFNPTTKLPEIHVRAKKSRPPADEILGEILGRATGRYQIWLRLAAYAGLRCCEIASLDRSDVTQDATWVRGKGGHERLIPTHGLVWEVLGSLPPGPVALNTDGTQATRQDVSRNGNQYLQRTLGFPHVHMHLLRKWFGTQAYLASGHDIRAAQELLGHAAVTTTQLYVAVTQSARAQAVDGLPVLVQPRAPIAGGDERRRRGDLGEDLESRFTPGVEVLAAGDDHDAGRFAGEHGRDGGPVAGDDACDLVAAGGTEVQAQQAVSGQFFGVGQEHNCSGHGGLLSLGGWSVGPARDLEAFRTTAR